MSDFTLSLGGVTFRDFEVPEEIRGFGGEQTLILHKLPGGARVGDAMGRDDAPIEWSGRFRGADALSRARKVDALRVAGKPVFLAFADVLETVWVKTFRYDVRMLREVPYSITLEVFSDDSEAAAGAGVDGTLRTDLASVLALGGRANSTGLTGMLKSISSAMGAVHDFAAATQAEVNSVVQPIMAARAQVRNLIVSAEGAVSAAQSFAQTGDLTLIAPIGQTTVNALAAAQNTPAALAALFGRH